MPWEGGWLVGDNETPDRLFRFTADLAPAGETKLGDPVDDIEALALAGDRPWVVGSQSANKEGKVRPLRERVALLGQPAFTPDLTTCPACIQARGRAPNRGGLNVEGAAVWDGRLWLGLRAPLEGDRALLLQTDADPSKPTAFTVTRAMPVDLGGLGVRELVPWKQGLLVIAGPVDDAAVAHQLWWLASPDAAPQRLPVDLPPGTEGIAPTGDGLLLVTDGDGKPGSTCAKPATWQRLKVTLP